MLQQFLESFVLVVAQNIAQNLGKYAIDRVNYKPTLDSLESSLKSLSAQASDVKEQTKNAELLGKKKRKGQVENWLEDIQKLEDEFLELQKNAQTEGFISGFFGGDRAINLIARMDKLVEESRHFGELVLDVYGKGEPFLTTKAVGGEFEENFGRIWELLATDKVSSIGIYGMGGVGKTTLAKHIHNRFLENRDCVCWVTVSASFSIGKLQDAIARFVGLDLSDESDEDKRAARLCSVLFERSNFVLILDDVWKSISLEKVGYPIGVEWCKVIVTSRSRQVCHQIGCRELIALRTLNEDEAWDLFQETLGREMILTPQVQEIAKTMVKECAGLPLGIITLAGSMKGDTDIHVWRDALAQLKESVMGQEDMEEQVFKVLKYSFDRLGEGKQKWNGYTKLQCCFLYCCLYPEDFRIEKDKLISRFISEQFLDRKSRKGQIDEGHAILNKLVNVCLLESTRNFENHDCVKMHDLVRDMALKITEGETMVIAGHHSLNEIPNEEEWTKDLDKVSLMQNDIQEIPDGMSPHCPKLSTLLLNQNKWKFMPDSFFSQMPGLSNLDLSSNHLIKELPNSLFNLENLKALILNECFQLKKVPYLGNLKAMKELDLTGSGIEEVPQGMEELVNLKCLKISAINLKMFPRGLLLKYGHLECLHLPFHLEAPIEEVERLKHLEEFRGRVKDVCHFNRLIGPSLSYSVIVAKNIDYYIHLQLLLSRDLNQAIMFNSDIKKEERKDVVMSAQDIRHLSFWSCKGLSNCFMDDFPLLSMNTKSLKTLDISDCKGVEYILRSEEFQQESESPFCALEEIGLNRLGFKGVIMPSQIGGAVAASPPQPIFSSLKMLDISFCHKMKNLGLPVWELQNLEKIFISQCEKLEEIIQEVVDISLPRLKKLSLHNLPRLQRICNATMICNSIQNVYLSKCPSLKKLPLFFPPCINSSVDAEVCQCFPPPALRQIWLSEKSEREWWASLEWDHSNHIHLLQPFLLVGLPQ